MEHLTSRPLLLKFPPYGIQIIESHHRRGFVMRPRANDYLKLYYVLDGEADFMISGQMERLAPQSVFVIPKSAVHFLRDAEDRPLSLYILGIRDDALEHLSTFDDELRRLELFASQRLRTIHARDHAAYEIPRAFRRILYEQRMKRDGYVATIQAAVLNLVAGLNRIFQNVPMERPIEGGNDTVSRIIEVARYVESNFYEPITVEKAARMAFLSIRQFTHQFKTVHGVTFLEFLHYHRIRYARDLLKHTNQEILTVCFEAGFNDLAHFYRIFKRLTGTSPRRYRLSEQERVAV
jgi:AraC-like DNA-binding protein/quercetin dioxygenase-like cupin family protein